MLLKMSLLTEIFNEEMIRRYIHVLLTTGNGIHTMFCIGGVKIDFYCDRYCFTYKTIYFEKPYGLSLTPVNMGYIIKEVIDEFRKIQRCTDCGNFSHIVDTIDQTCVECLQNKCIKKPDDNCSICLVPLSDRRCVQIRKCGHYFHYSCEKKFRGHSSDVRCPLCREPYIFYDLQY
jgi:hypothetical protein